MKPIKNFVKLLLVLFLLQVLPQCAQAQKSMAIAGAPVNSIRYVGMEGELLLFELELNALPAGTCSLRIRDEANTIFFEQKIEGPVYRKRYKIHPDQFQHLQFEVIQGKLLLEQRFNLRYRVEEKFEVVRA